MDRPPSPQQQYYHGSGTCSDSGAVPQTGRDESTKRRASHQLVHTTWTAPKTDRNCSVTNKLLRKQSEAATWQTAPKTNRNCRVTNKLHSASGAVRPVTQSLTFQSRDCTYGLWRKRWHSSLGTAPPYLRPAYSRNHVSVTLALTPALISTVKLYLLWLPTLASACSRFLIYRWAVRENHHGRKILEQNHRWFHVVLQWYGAGYRLVLVIVLKAFNASRETSLTMCNNCKYLHDG